MVQIFKINRNIFIDEASKDSKEKYIFLSQPEQKLPL